MCIDYRALNECIGHMNWPLPNILHMVDRIGAKKPKIFAKFDMTKGYWQLALSAALRVATAFITSIGIFVWNRIPMGLQPASSYFQYCMTTVVLVGLMYEICESYIDDIIVHAQHEDDMLKNLKDVFERFRRYNIKLNPKKSIIGLLKIEYVGHQIDAEGMHFTKEKLSEVATFATPQGAKGLRSFLGLTQYFLRRSCATIRTVRATIARCVTKTSLGKLATHDVLKMTHLTKTAPIFTFSLPCNSVLSNGAYFAFLLP